MTPFIRLILATCFILCATIGLARADGYPAYTSITVNDFADVLTPQLETRLDRRLTDLRAQHGIEMTLVTLERYDAYAPRDRMSFEQFATGLFDHWGVGDDVRNDGVMVLLARGDRAVRIELGAGFGRDWDRAAANVIDDHFLDAFAAGDFAGGFDRGSQAVIDEIVLPFLAGEDAPSAGNDPVGIAILGMIFAVVGAGIFGGPIRNRLRRCPKCGRRNQSEQSETIRAPSRNVPGQGRRRITCPHCDHTRDETYIIASLNSRNAGLNGGRSNGGRSFGGGSSGGGGASGRF
ncbi:TPM domain-containing protein [Roseobacteraceae bacterium S113]